MLKLLVLSGLVGLTSVAHATTFNIGTLPVAPSVYTNTTSVSGSFADIYNFVFPSLGSTASGSAVSINISPILVIDNINVSIFDTSNSLVAAGPIGSSSVLFDVALTPGASYYYSVTGTAIGQAGGTYSFLASAAPVPEPAAWALMLAGLVSLGCWAKRRRVDG